MAIYDGTYEIVKSQESNKGLPKNLIERKIDVSICQQCGSKLEQSYTLIPINSIDSVKIKGGLCRRCNLFYVNSKQELRWILQGNVRASEFLLNGEFLFNKLPTSFEENKKTTTTVKKRDKNKWLEKDNQKAQADKSRQKKAGVSLDTSKTKGSFIDCSRINDKLAANSAITEKILIRVLEQRTRNQYIIVMDEKERRPLDGIFYYREENARELLTAAFHPSRKRLGVIFGNEFTVTDVNFIGSGKQRGLQDLIVDHIFIKSGGGYLSNDIDGDTELTDVCVYSPFKKRYEFLTVTRDKSNGDCYVDYKKYRDFAYAFGKPDLNIIIPVNKNDGSNNWAELNAESILKGYGYCVDEKNDLGKQQRHQILMDLVDLDLMKVSTIVNYLDFFIRSHPNQIFERARSKWQSDKIFIENYKVNHDRFAIFDKRIPRTTLLN